MGDKGEHVMPTEAEEQEIMNRRHYTGYNVRVVMFMSLATYAYGYSGSIISTTLGQPSFLHYMGLDTASNGTQLMGAMTALYFAGGAFGCITGSFLADRWGRKCPVYVGAVFLIISGALLTGSVATGMFITFRFFNGFGGYMLLAAIPLYITELVPPRGRGWLVDQVAIWNVFGYVSASWVGFGFYFYHGNGNEWRPPLSFQIVPAIILLCGLRWMPESPRWLISKDRTDEAFAILTRLHSRPGESSNQFAKAEFVQIKKQHELDSRFQSSYLSMLTYGPYRKRLIIGSLWIFFIQSSGPLVIVNYSPTVYGLLGYGPLKQLLYSSAWLTLTFGANIISAFTIDLLPRNKYVSIGLFSCLTCLVLEAALVATYVGATPVNAAGLKAATFSVFLFALAYGIFMDGAMFTYVGEIYPNHLRSRGVNLALATHALVNILYTTPAPTGFKNIGWKYYLPFICVSIVGVVAIWLYFPDTRNLPLEEIAKLFGDDEMVAIYQKDLTNPDSVDAKVQHIDVVENVEKV